MGIPKADVNGNGNNDLIRYWPFAAGGLVGPLLSGSLATWLPSPFAAACSFFMAFFAAFYVFDRISSANHVRLMRGLLASAAGGVVAGVLTYLFPW